MQNTVISRLEGVRVAVLGDVMLDRFVYGTVERISPEAPIPVLRKEREITMLGGAGNVARNIASLGDSPCLIGLIGDDADGELVSGPLSHESTITAQLLKHPTCPTIVKTRFVSAQQQIMRLDAEQRFDVSEQLFSALDEALSSALAQARALVLSDYAKGLLSPEVLRLAIDRARELGVPVVVDPKSRDLSIYAGADFVTPNALEAEAITGIKCADDGSAALAARRIIDETDIGAVLITRGAQGMTLLAPARGVTAPVHIATSAVRVFDVSGAGDTVIASLALMLGAGEGAEDAAQLASVTAGIAVAKPGTATVDAAELSRALAFEQSTDVVLPADRAAEQVAAWRAQGLQVGFANGCFDLIHPGHVKLLERARSTCDRLVVALNTDASVRRLKGEHRPLQSEDARAAIMASIRSVDLVTHFDEDTPLELIAKMKPDVLIKGADYKVHEVVGHDLVSSWGGRVELIPLAEGQSTTGIVRRAKDGLSAALGN